MPLGGMDACKRALRVTRAQFRRGVGDLREIVRKRSKSIKKTRGQLRKLEAKVKELGGALSEEVSDGSSVLCDTSSDSDSDSDMASDDVKAEPSSASDNGVGKKAVSKEQAPKAKASAAGVPKVQPGPPSKAKAKAVQGGAPPSGRRSKQSFPEIPPGEVAPLHKGKPNAEGVRYPGFPKGDARRCDACEQVHGESAEARSVSSYKDNI